MAGSHQAAAPTLDPLNAATFSEAERRVDDAKVVYAQPAEKAADELTISYPKGSAKVRIFAPVSTSHSFALPWRVSSSQT